MKKTTQNPSSIKPGLAICFLRALKKIKNTTQSSSTAGKTQRHHAIRAAAYASMASVVGPNKAWSRALLRKIKNRHRLSTAAGRRSRNPRINQEFGPENDLRELIPGGKALDLERLLNETGHYIKCLRAQVEVMRKIADFSSK